MSKRLPSSIAFTISFHYIYPPLSIGLSLCMVADLRKANQKLKEMVADPMLLYDIVKKS
jgi:cytochrome bd-type quinol oxidase subunit 1